MAGGGFITVAAGATAATGVARVTGAASSRHRPRQCENASVRINAPTPRPHKSFRLPTSVPIKKHNGNVQS